GGEHATARCDDDHAAARYGDEQRRQRSRTCDVPPSSDASATCSGLPDLVFAISHLEEDEGSGRR
ncbi:hypothetical protein U1Q18_023628, partial [Sarracenia purpurea var. burkii]